MKYYLEELTLLCRDIANLLVKVCLVFGFLSFFTLTTYAAVGFDKLDNFSSLSDAEKVELYQEFEASPLGEQTKVREYVQGLPDGGLEFANDYVRLMTSADRVVEDIEVAPEVIESEPEIIESVAVTETEDDDQGIILMVGVFAIVLILIALISVFVKDHAPRRTARKEDNVYSNN